VPIDSSYTTRKSLRLPGVHERLDDKRVIVSRREREFCARVTMGVTTPNRRRNSRRLNHVPDQSMKGTVKPVKVVRVEDDSGLITVPPLESEIPS